MKLRLLILVFALLQSTYCKSLSAAKKDLSTTFNDLFKYVKVNLLKITGQLKKLIIGGGGGNSKTMVQLDDKQMDLAEKKAFGEFMKYKEGTEHTQYARPEFVNLKSESMVQLATPQLARWHGRNMESHIVETKDGYCLTLHRISSGPLQDPSRTVLLHHGLLGSSTDWILLGAEKSLPYILVDAGYDVWITNARGNYYSRGHISMTVDFPEYWNFSWQEMGQYDLPAVIDYIRLVKDSKESINFIGHSMGATALLVLLSTAPHYNEYLRMGILLAPLAYMKNIEGPLKSLTSVSEEIIRMMGDGEFLPTRRVPSWLAHKYCKGARSFCSNPLLFLSGVPEEKRRNASFIARLLYHVPAGGSINTILHYIQLAKSGKFHKYNDESSEFPICNITLPLALFSSSDDWLASVADVLKLYFCIPNPIDHHIIRGRNMTHTDFVWGTEATVLVFDKIVEYLENGLTWNMMKSNEV